MQPAGELVAIHCKMFKTCAGQGCYWLLPQEICLQWMMKFSAAALHRFGLLTDKGARCCLLLPSHLLPLNLALVKKKVRGTLVNWEMQCLFVWYILLLTSCPDSMSTCFHQVMSLLNVHNLCCANGSSHFTQARWTRGLVEMQRALNLQLNGWSRVPMPLSPC